MARTKEFEIVAFATAKAWRQWLAKNHAASDGIWLRLFKKTSGAASVTYDEALDEALCYGWIDGQLKSGDEKSWLRKFTPRGAKSTWSKKNRGHVARLTKSGRMTAAGLRAGAMAGPRRILWRRRVLRPRSGFAAAAARSDSSVRRAPSWS